MIQAWKGHSVRGVLVAAQLGMVADELVAAAVKSLTAAAAAVVVEASVTAVAVKSLAEHSPVACESSVPLGLEEAVVFDATVEAAVADFEVVGFVAAVAGMLEVGTAAAAEPAVVAVENVVAEVGVGVAAAVFETADIVVAAAAAVVVVHAIGAHEVVAVAFAAAEFVAVGLLRFVPDAGWIGVKMST